MQSVPQTSPSTDALLEVGRWLQSGAYAFTAITPTSHRRVLARNEGRKAADVRDVFGWNLPFDQSLLPARVFEALRDGDALEPHSGNSGSWRSRVRFATLDGALYAHSSFPTSDEDAVFFGPDTYRFCALIGNVLGQGALSAGAGARVIDIGCGAGPGGLHVARLCRAAGLAAPDLTLADINPRALLHAGVNAALADCEDVRLAQSDLFSAVDGAFDLIVSNPPYLVDASERRYRHGGGELGSALSERIAEESLNRLAPGGRLVLYTASAIVDGRDPFRARMEACAGDYGWPFDYREIDPDVFGEELGEPAYARADRIAVVALVVRRPGAAA